MSTPGGDRVAIEEDDRTWSAAEIAAPWSRAVLVAALFVVVGCGAAQSGAASTSPAPSPVEPSIVSPEPATPEPSGSAPAASVRPSPIADAVLLAAGDIAACSKEGDSATAAILAQYPDARVQTLGDNAYDKGTPASSAASTTRGASRMTVCSPPWVGTTT